MAEIVFEGVSKEYPNGLHAIRSLDLEIHDGEFLVLVGPSGCGKSTALRMVAGLEDITGGTILIGGRRANDLSPRERNVAMVFQSYALYPHLSVAENIGFGLRVRGVARETIAAKVRATAEMLELTDYIDRKPEELSGGQRQRVAMGRAIIREPAAFLMDEPLSNLDARLRVHMRAEIARIQKMTGVTTIYVTHDQVEAMTMGDRVAVLDRGILQQLGAPRALYHQPANLFVASFIGSPAINLLEGRLIQAANGVEILVGAQRIDPPPALVTRLSPLARHGDRPVILGIRPEAVHCLPSGADPGRAIWGTVAFMEDLGATILVHLDVDAPEPRLDLNRAGLVEEEPEAFRQGNQARVRTGVDGMSTLRPGDRVPLVLDVNRIHFFDSASGLSLGSEIN
ncbi:MAG: ABC transporter ATP-binding protein [Hyphomicrobiales bacterium]